MTADGKGGLHSDAALADVRRARRQLPSEHKALLDQLGVQECVVDDWPGGVQDLYRTILEAPPRDEALKDAAAVWLDGLRVVAFNAPFLKGATAGLNRDAARGAIAVLAWHEYGHALSVTRSTAEHKRDGVRLLGLLPPGIRAAIDYPGGYRQPEVFDEVIATVYAVMVVGVVRAGVYSSPDWLHADVYEAFQEVIPWPPRR